MAKFNSDLWYTIFLRSDDKLNLLYTLPLICKSAWACVSDPHRHFVFVKAIEEEAKLTGGTLQEQLVRTSNLIRTKRARCTCAVQMLSNKDLAGYTRLLKEGLTVDQVLDSSGITALFICAKDGWVDGLKFLHHHKAQWPTSYAAPKYVLTRNSGYNSTLIGLTRLEFEGKCVVEIATANLANFPEFNPVYTSILYHQQEALAYLVTCCDHNFIAEVNTNRYPAIFWNYLRPPFGTCSRGWEFYYKNYGEHVRLSNRIQNSSGLEWTILEQELRRPDMKFWFIKFLVDAPHTRNPEDQETYEDNVLSILHVKNVATELLRSKGDEGLKEESELLNSVGWLGLNPSDEIYHELQQTTEYIKSKFKPKPRP